MTWLSFITKSSGYLIILPLILLKLNPEEIAIWYLFVTIISLQYLADLGFSQTFSRIISYAVEGSSIDEISDKRVIKKPILNELNLDTLIKVWGTMNVIYNWLAFIAFFLLITFGTLTLIEPISKSNNESSAWLSWSIILLSSLFLLRGNKYSSYILGSNKVALLRRWEAIFSIISVFSNVIVIFFDGGLLGLVLINQFWSIINIFRNKWISQNINDGFLKKYSRSKFDKQVFNSIWPSVWRSGLGILFAQGPTQLSGLIYAQIGSPTSVAQFLIALRILRLVSSFSQAPFYSKIPLLNGLRAKGMEIEQIKVAKKGMRLSYVSFVFGWLIVGIFSKILFDLLNSSLSFIDVNIWILLGFGALLERYGAMHLHIYSTTNHIIWHIANGITSILFFSFAFLLIKNFGLAAFPIAMIFSNIFFYCWYTARKSYKLIRSSFITFELSTSLIPFIIFLVSSCLLSILN